MRCKRPNSTIIRLTSSARWAGGGSRVRRDATHQPISVRALALALPTTSYRTVTWRDGTTAAHADHPRAEEWLLIEWPTGEPEPTHYFLSTLSAALSCRALVATVKLRWRIERDYLELKQEVGLGHYEGRNWRGVHHHASLCIAAYGFLMLERLAAGKKTSLDSTRLPYPPASGRAGLAPMQRHVPWSIAIVRFRLGRALARQLPQCPWCGKPFRRVSRDY